MFHYLLQSSQAREFSRTGQPPLPFEKIWLMRHKICLMVLAAQYEHDEDQLIGGDSSTCLTQATLCCGVWKHHIVV